MRNPDACTKHLVDLTVRPDRAHHVTPRSGIRTVTPTGPRDPCDDDSRVCGDRHASTCARGTRASCCACGCSAGMSSSRPTPLITLPNGSKARRLYASPPRGVNDAPGCRACSGDAVPGHERKTLFPSALKSVDSVENAACVAVEPVDKSVVFIVRTGALC